MKQISVFFLSWFLSAFSYKVIAQPGKATKKETEEIVIRSTGDDEMKMTIVIDGDNITVNGKPLSEFKDDNVSVKKRNIIVREGDHFKVLDRMGHLAPEVRAWGFNNNSKVLLGVSTDKTDKGLTVVDVTEGSPAEKAGLKEGDIITKFENTTVNTPQELFDAVNKEKEGKEVTVHYKRNGKNAKATAKLEARKNMSFAMTSPDGVYRSFDIPAVPDVKVFSKDLAELHKLKELQGMALENLHENGNFDFRMAFRKSRLGLRIQDTENEKGVKVLGVDDESAAAKAGIKEGDIITEIAGKKVKNTDEAREVISDNDEKSNYSVSALRDNKAMTFEIKIPKDLKTTNL